MAALASRRVWRDRRGGVAALAGFGLAAIIGVAAIAVDLSYAYMIKNWLQTTADTAAIVASGALPDADAARARALEYADKNMPSVDHGTVVANTDVEIGNWDANTRTFTAGEAPLNAVRVVARRSKDNGNPVGLFFANVLGFSETDVAVAAIATAEAGQPGCILALDPGNTSRALRFNSMDSVQLHDCVPAANSTNSSAIKLNSLDSFNAGSLYSAGGYSAGSIGSLNLDDPAQTYQEPIPDPFASLAEPSPVGCDYNDEDTSGTISPGIYCGGLKVSGSATLQPGTYYIVDGDLEFSSIGSVGCNCSAAGSGVTFVITESAPGLAGTFEFSSIDSLSLRAPSDSSYDYPGMLIYVDRDADYDTSKFNSIDSLTMNGVVYAPSQNLQFNSIDYTAQTDCAATVAFHVEYNSMDSFGRADNCAAYGSSGISLGGAAGSLVQ